MFIYPAIKQDKEVWRVEYKTRSGHLKSVRVEATTKQYGSRFAEICSGNRRSCPKS